MKRPIEAIIEDVVIDPKKIQPIIVNFHNGHLKDEETESMKCGLYYDEKKKKNVLAMSNGQIVYKGYRPDHSKEPTYTMLAIHNKKTNKIRLVQVERWDVAPVLDQHVDNSNDDDVDKIATLNKQFGSKKIKRRTEQYERMKINVENVKETLEKTVSHVKIDKGDLEPESKDDFVSGMLLPPCNRDATDVSDVYCVDDIVPKNILKTLYSQAVEIAEGDIGEKPLFFEKTVEKVKNDPKSAVKIATLLYIESVMNWLNIQLKLGRKNDVVVCPHSVEVNAYVLETYSISTPNGRCRPNTMKDKGLIHCIILGLIIWNYTLDLELFSTMIIGRMGIKKLSDLAKLVCATPLKDKKSVILKLPLPNPPAKVMTKRTKINK